MGASRLNSMCIEVCRRPDCRIIARYYPGAKFTEATGIFQWYDSAMEFFANLEEPLLWASGLSLLAAVASIIAAPWVATRLPHDYFSKEERVVWRATSDAPLLVLVIAALKNLLGLLLIILGLVMLVTPGQGILTLLIGLLLINFPGKYRLERWLVLRPGVLRGLNWLRERRGYQPFNTPPQHTSDD